ncbi:MAG: glycosyltransferase family 4 protein, partial [Patescibacteria group bacterium]
WGVQPEKITVIYNAFENEISQSHLDLEQKPIIFSVGRLVPWKGFSTLIALMPRLLIAEPELQLLIAGDGPDQAVLREQIIRLNLGANVKLLGRLVQADLFAQLTKSRIFILNTAYEGFSHQLLEVMALGLPIITTRVGGNPELISSGENGLFVPYDDKTALVEAIEKLLADPVLSQKLGQAAKERVRVFTKERMIRELIDLFRANENS